VRGDRGVWEEAWYPRGGVIAIFCLWTLCLLLDIVSDSGLRAVGRSYEGRSGRIRGGQRATTRGS
jgi:hypothetical protein